MANRATRRKGNIKSSKNNKKEVIVQDENTSNVVRLIIIVLIVFLIFYGITSIITSLSTKAPVSNNNDTDSTPAEIQYDEILVGETFNINRSEYYVLFFDFDDNNAISYNSYVSAFKTSHPTSKVYIVDLSKGFNKSCVSETSNPGAQVASDLKIKESALIKINNGVNVSFIEGKDAIRAALK